MTTVLANVPSESNPAKSYQVLLGGDNNIYCTCPAWKFQKLPPKERTCKHMIALAAQMKQVAGKMPKAAVTTTPATPAKVVPQVETLKLIEVLSPATASVVAPVAVSDKKAALAAKKAALAAEEAALEAEEKAAAKLAERSTIETEIKELKAKLALAEARLSVL